MMAIRHYPNGVTKEFNHQVALSSKNHVFGVTRPGVGRVGWNRSATGRIKDAITMLTDGDIVHHHDSPIPISDIVTNSDLDN